MAMRMSRWRTLARTAIAVSRVHRLGQWGWQRPPSKPQHLAAQVQILRQRPRRSDVRHLPALERHGAIRQSEREIEVVIDDQDRDLFAQLVEGFKQLLDHGRRQAL